MTKLYTMYNEMSIGEFPNKNTGLVYCFPYNIKNVFPDYHLPCNKHHILIINLLCSWQFDNYICKFTLFTFKYYPALMITYNTVGNTQS